MNNYFLILHYLILFALFLSGCQVNDGKRPRAVHKEAIWYGGADGGNWIHTVKCVSDSGCLISVRSDYNCMLLDSGWYVVKSDVEQLADYSDTFLKSNISFYNGKKIGVSMRDKRIVYFEKADW
jgi:hypothetical protein